MLRFCGFEIELEVNEVLDRRDEEPAVCAASDRDGRRWLIVEGQGAPEERSWYCAPVSDLAVQLVATGRARPSDAVLHSSTGWVEVVRLIDGHAVPDARVLCADLVARGMAAVAS